MEQEAKKNIDSCRATYEPESNKLRLYVGRLPRDEYLKLRAEGWTALHKQRDLGGGDFAATWTPERRDTALEYAGIIEDEDMTSAERAADRAERFGGYREKRTDEATGHADRYDAGPQVHGFQNYGRAVRAADRHDRIASRACDAWSKAEYWQRRTAGVISHALHVSTPGVRMGRIKELEAEIRKCEKSREEYAGRYELWQKVAAMTDPERQNALALKLAYVEHGNYTHPRTGRVSYLYDHARREEGRNDDPLTGAEVCALWLANHDAPTEEGDWLTHYRLRLAYENQMLEAQGGRAAFVEMEAGGWLGSRQIRKVCKSPATGRVVSVEVMGSHSGFTRESGYKSYETRPCPVLVNVERLAAEVYRAPTDEDRAALAATVAAEKAARPEKAPCPLINPTDADAERLQAIWNERASAFKPAEVQRITQAVYSANSKRSYARAETRGLCANAELEDRDSNMWSASREARRKRIGRPLCMIRITGFNPESVIVITDKPQKPLPAAVWSPRVEVQAEITVA